MTLCAAAAIFSEPTSAADYTPAAVTLAEKYVALLGCPDEKINIKNVARVDGTNDKYFLQPYYVIGTNADLDCSGGSGAVKTQLIVVGTAPGNLRPSQEAGYIQQKSDLRILPDLSSPFVFMDGQPRYLTSVYVKDGQLWATGLDYDFPGDGMCCPSLAVTYRIELEKSMVKDDKGHIRNANAWLFRPMGSYKKKTDSRPRQ